MAQSGLANVVHHATNKGILFGGEGQALVQVQVFQGLQRFGGQVELLEGSAQFGCLLRFLQRETQKLG